MDIEAFRDALLLETMFAIWLTAVGTNVGMSYDDGLDRIFGRDTFVARLNRIMKDS